MDNDKQIAEMAKVLNECCNEYDVNGRHIRNKCNPYDCEYWSDDNHCCCSYNTKEAIALYTAGYRKASDLVNEIFADVFKAIRKYYIEAEHSKSITCELMLDYLKGDIAELKKKYTESEDTE